MTATEMLFVGFFALLFAGTSAFLAASHNTRWDAKYNAIPQYVELADISQYGFKGTLPP